MNNSAIPSRLTVVFSVNGDKNTIPTNSTPDTLAEGLAAMDSGFPPLTRTAISAGGKPPQGQDFNGIFNDVYTRLQWGMSGMSYPYNATFSTAISGYPKGALVPSSDYSGRWLNLNDANTKNPESATGENTGWVPSDHYGVTSISGLASSNITLSTSQAAKSRIILSGALTANIKVIFPAWIKDWTIENNTTGAYQISAITALGSGINIKPGVSGIHCDGTNITSSDKERGRLLNIRTFKNSTTYIPTPGTTAVFVQVQGGGGAGGGCVATGNNQVSVGAGGSAGSYAEGYYTSGFSGVSIVVGASGKSSIGGDGTDGGASSFGNLLSCPGGIGGKTSGAVAAPYILGNGASPMPSGNSVVAMGGEAGQASIALAVNGGYGAPGGSSMFGAGGGARVQGLGGVSAIGYGAGGSGTMQVQLAGATNGGGGAQGIVIVWEYS